MTLFPPPTLHKSETETHNRKWLAFCINGRHGVSSLVPIPAHLQTYGTGDYRNIELLELCEAFYGDWKAETETLISLEPSLEFFDVTQGLDGN
jgi:hypothetical protein